MQFAAGSMSTAPPATTASRRALSKQTQTQLLVEGGVPAIVEKSLYDRVTQKLAMRKRAPKKKTNHTYILSGLLKCGECGGTMAGDSMSAKRAPAYRCAGKGCPLGHWRIGGKNIEKLVIDIVWDKFLHVVTPKAVARQIEDFAADETTDVKKVFAILRIRLP